MRSMRSRCPFAAVVLLAGAASTAWAQNPAVTVAVDAAANRRPIDPRIYGLNFASTADLAALNCPINRSGGNAASRHNWQQNATNRGSDWYFESLEDSGGAVAGADADAFVSGSRSTGAEPMITIPMVGRVAKLGNNRARLCSFSIAKYGPQTDADWQWFPDAGNGILSSGAYVQNDPNDANVPADEEFQRGWIRHLLARWGSANAGGVRHYLLDNEHGLWHGTHRDVHPGGATMEEVRAKMIAYATMIKSEDPSALVLGPEEWGWTGYLVSGYDLQWADTHGWSNLPDKAAHGGQDYLPWLLDQLRRQEALGGPRLLDVFTVHYYPQSGEFSDTTTSTMQLRRNRSTRSLWDPSYIDESWIADRVQLIPRLKNWAATYYRPGTPVGITEYNWGAEGHINGATAQADILGIFGREGVAIGTRWTTPAATTPTYKAFQMYRNYDGLKSTFGDTSVSASGPNPDQLASFAAVRSSDGALTVMLVHKNLSGTTPVTVNLSGFAAGGTAQVWQLRSTNRIERLADLTVSGNAVAVTVPPQSITLLVVPSGATIPTPTPTATPSPRVTAAPTLTPTPTATPTPVTVPTPTPSPGATPAVLFSASFDASNDGFTYVDDAFRATLQPRYASGTRVTSGGFQGGALSVRVGGVDNVDVTGMSGGWRRTFTLTAPTSLTLRFRLRLSQSPDYEPGEYTDALLSRDGILIGTGGLDRLARVVGNGEGGASPTTGWQLYAIDLGLLDAGTHTLILGGYNNQKSHFKEFSDVLVDDVQLRVN